ncbi:TIGR04282 family arsenosugar biosynthesis glycosyltransferase [bacterium]|nr:TIGR04282 family arsenosugar biosynthesis glycosyltransferase [bacterium]
MIVVARNPFNSRVKTRLADTLGKEVARGVYTRLVYETLLRMIHHRTNSVKITLSLANGTGRDTFHEAFPELTVTHQCKGNIGVRMMDAIRQAFEQGAEKAVLIGSDIPGITWDIVEQAFDVIDDETVAIGPAKDGGFYLIGMQSPGVDIFENIPWSTSGVLACTISNITQQGCLPGFVPTLQDIDYAEDLRRWQASFGS